jgi:hypothetical protein
MSIKIDKNAYEKLIKEDLDFLNEHCPDSLDYTPWDTFKRHYKMFANGHGN